jgi:serine/threonine-protein kinase
MSRDPRLFQPGDIVQEKYKIVRLIGRGGMGIVYEAHHELLGHQVALKVVLPEIGANPEILARFMSEARNSAKIESDHVARVMDVGKLEGGAPFMVMELLNGQDLDAILAQEGPLPAARVADLMVETLDGVASAHALGIIHRDLKPGNLFVSQKAGRPPRVKVLDFGISKSLGGQHFAGAHVTSTSSIVGSPAYMSPEQLRGSKDIDGRADIWSLGVIAYQLSTGALPYDADNVGALFAAILETEPLRPRDRVATIPEALDAAIMKCLQKKPADRFQTVIELAKALGPLGTRTAERALERIEGLIIMTPTKQFKPTISSPDIAASPNPLHVPEAFASTHISNPHLELEPKPPPQTQGSWAGGSTPPKKPGRPLVFIGLAFVGLIVAAFAIHTITSRPAVQAMALTSSATASTPVATTTPPITTPDIPATIPTQALASASASSAPTAAASASPASSAHAKRNAKPAASGKNGASDDIFGRF